MVRRVRFVRKYLAPRHVARFQRSRTSHRINHIRTPKSFWQKLWEKLRRWRVWACDKKICRESTKKVQWRRRKWCLRALATFLGENHLAWDWSELIFTFCLTFRPDITPMAVIRCPSMNRNLGSELSTSCGSLLNTRRPRSCNVSSESLPSFLPSSALNQVQQYFLCPAGGNCFEERITGASLTQHINEVHQHPTISFGTSSADISLPPRAPIENASLILLLDETQFWVKIANL